MSPLRLPWPPSVNTYWRSVKGRVLISKKGREYRTRVRAESLLQRFARHGDARLSVTVQAFPPDRRRRDLDNVLKALLDALQQAGVYDDDSQIDELTIRRRPVAKPGMVVVYVKPVEVA